MTDAFSEPVDSVAGTGDEFPDEVREDAAEQVPGDAGENLPSNTDEEGPADEAGIPDEPEAFVEELRAAGDLPETGEPRVDGVLAQLDGIEDVPTAEHVGVYDEVHRGLQDALANLDQS
ncbi:MAG TPA: hypothetical protein VMZ00_17105 [Sporichthya sp.]|nr:hypothetical protein [Sporichthya sp.]